MKSCMCSPSAAWQACRHTRTHTHTYTHTHIHVHPHTHTHTHPRQALLHQTVPHTPSVWICLHCFLACHQLLSMRKKALLIGLPSPRYEFMMWKVMHEGAVELSSPLTQCSLRFPWTQPLCRLMWRLTLFHCLGSRWSPTPAV